MQTEGPFLKMEGPDWFPLITTQKKSVSASMACAPCPGPDARAASKIVDSEKWPAVQDMYTRLSSGNLDFDSELQHVFWLEPDECRNSRVSHVDRVFLRLC